jgi:hypothetical protein
MKISALMKIAISVGLFSFSTSGLTDNIGTGDQQLMDVACRYETKMTPYDQSVAPSTTTWFFWRKPNMIQTQDAEGHYGEIWERTANGSIQYRKFYPDDKTAVEYMSADRPAYAMDFDWIKLSSMLSQQELDALKPVENKQVLGHNATLRRGKTGDQTLEVLWLTSEQLPASIIREDKTGRVELRLVEITPFSEARRKPLAIEEIANYRQIDAADFGDMENDPFVKKLMAQEGHHAH